MPFSTKIHFSDLTVFIVSAGEDTTLDCEKALLSQDCSFAIQHIKDTYPMSRAFQRMPDECKTPYFIQVDGDMILKPHAIRTLYEGTKSSSFMTYMSYGQLFEDGFGVGGSVRCWKKWLFNFFKFRDCRTVDRDLYHRVRWTGLRSKDLKQVLGLHIARHSPFSNYLKTKSDIEKWRFLGRPPETYAQAVVLKSIAGLPRTSYELFGALLGAMTGNERLRRSKDIRVESQRFTDILRILGVQTIEFDGKLDAKQLERIFMASYRDTSLSNTKMMLAETILKLLGRSDTAKVDDFIKIITR
ncbi:MAG TPA: hypothetical protein PK876_09020 [Elusimicrobiota bacterium]|nr:hypothetical protein [Elusimicrobiota bacterium]